MTTATLCPHCGKDGVGEKTGRCLVCGYDARSAATPRDPGVLATWNARVAWLTAAGFGEYRCPCGRCDLPVFPRRTA